MRISKKGEYGLRILLHLTLLPEKGLARASSIAAQQHIPLKFLEQILIVLRNKGFIGSFRGAHGGYYLASPPASISLKEALTALEHRFGARENGTGLGPVAGALSDTLNARHLPGLRFYPVTFTPAAAKFPNERCEGVFIVITDRGAVRSARLGVELASALTKMAPDKFLMDTNLRLIGTAADIAKIKAGDDPAMIAAAWSGAEARWRLLRAKYLLY